MKGRWSSFGNDRAATLFAGSLSRTIPATTPIRASVMNAYYVIAI